MKYIDNESSICLSWKERFHPSHIDKFQEWGFIEMD